MKLVGISQYSKNEDLDKPNKFSLLTKGNGQYLDRSYMMSNRRMDTYVNSYHSAYDFYKSNNAVAYLELIYE